MALSGAGDELCGVLPDGTVRCALVGLLQQYEHYDTLAGLRAPLQLAPGFETCALTRAREVVCWQGKRTGRPARVVLPSPPSPR